jgi:hypothetical protein
MIAAFVFIVRRLMSLDAGKIDYRAFLEPRYFVAVICFIVVSILANVGYAFSWRQIISCLASRRVPFKLVFPVYAKSNIAKYLPGNVAHYVGRQVFGYSLGIKQEKIVAATILEIVYSVCVSALLSLLFAGSIFVDVAVRWIRDNGMLVMAGLCILMALLIIGIILYANGKKRLVQQILSAVKPVEVLRILPLVVPVYCGIFISYGVMFALLMSVNTVVDISNFGIVIAASVASWLIGFITPGVPGGIGVRESVLILMLGPIFSTEIILPAAIIQRVVMIFGDVLAWVASLVIGRKKVSAP